MDLCENSPQCNEGQRNMGMTTELGTIVAPLFVPATRLDRLVKAAASGADAIIVDLEDAVEPSEKAQARLALESVEFPALPIILRINACDTEWYADDVKTARNLNLCAVMLPKAEDAAQLAKLHRTLGEAVEIIALVETVRGVGNLDEICGSTDVKRIAFGSVDFAADLGCAHTPESLGFARAQILFASRLAGLVAPLDGVTTSVSEAVIAQDDARRAAELGFGGKLCIHPNQIKPVRAGFAPTQAEVDWARKVLASDDAGASKVDGMMIDAPVRLRAAQIIRRVPDSKDNDGINQNV